MQVQVMRGVRFVPNSTLLTFLRAGVTISHAQRAALPQHCRAPFCPLSATGVQRGAGGAGRAGGGGGGGPASGAAKQVVGEDAVKLQSGALATLHQT